MSNSLAAVHPELVAEWSEKNLPLTPDSITFGSNKKVWWKGACGHEWQTSVKARSNGEKCPICSGARVIAGINDLATLEPLLEKQWSKKNKIKPTEVSIGSHKKVIWRCEKGHEWEAAVKSRTINKTGCPYCSHNKVLAGFNDLATLLPDIAAEWSDRNYPLLPTQVTVFANRKAWWKCKDCGREWNTLISTRSGGSKCPYCSGYIFLKGFNDLQTTHPEIASEWSEKNLSLKPDEVNAKSRKNVWWRCSKCGNEWKSVINARVKGTVCPVCAEREVLAGYNDLATTDSQLLSEWDYEKNKWKPTEVSRNSAKRAWWKCRHGHSWSMKINERTILNKGCRICEQEYLSLFPALAVSYDKWIVREIEQPKGFVLDEKAYEVNISKAEQVVEIEIVNEYVHGNIRLTKVDAEYPDNKLTGATFEVYKDTNENGKIDDGDELIGNLEETETGIYEMKELLYGKYIVRETKAPEGFLLDKGEYSVFIEKDETTYSVENKAGVGFINEAMRGTLKIVKTSSDGKVKGFAFRVTGANGYDMTFETDKNGEIVIEGLRIGEYTVSEVANNASAAYITPADQNVTIKLDETAVVKMHNELRDTPKTGDDTNMKLWYVLAGLSAVGIAVTSVVAHKKKKKEGNE